MRILWGALRAVSVETMGVLVVLWMLHGATGLAIDAPWWPTKSPQVFNERSAPVNTRTAPVDPERTVIGLADVGAQETTSDETQRASVRQWFNALFPTDLDKTPSSAAIEQRAEYIRDRLDHYSRLYGISSPN